MTEETLSDWFGCTCNCCERTKFQVKEAIRKILIGMRCGWREKLIKEIVGEKLI